MSSFEGQVVMVTAGTGILGGAVARAFAGEGAKVIVVDRNAKKQQTRFPDWVNSAKHWLAAPVDVLNVDDAAKTVAQVLERFGQVDVLVNTIGGYQAGKPVHEMGLEMWHHMLDLNARSTLV